VFLGRPGVLFIDRNSEYTAKPEFSGRGRLHPPSVGHDCEGFAEYRMSRSPFLLFPNTDSKRLGLPFRPLARLAQNEERRCAGSEAKPKRTGAETNDAEACPAGILPLANKRAATIGSGYGDKARQLLRQKLHCARRDAREKKQEPRQWGRPRKTIQNKLLHPD
jgi:hypothetical protein